MGASENVAGGGEPRKGCACVCWQVPDLEDFIPLSAFWGFIFGFTSLLQVLLCCLKGVTSSRSGIAASSRRHRDTC